MSHKIEKGQVYEPVRCPRCGGQAACPDHGAPPPIQVTGQRIPSLNGRGAGKVEIGTLTDEGRVIRKRLVNASDLHDGTTADGKPRRTGYRLVQDAPGDET